MSKKVNILFLYVVNSACPVLNSNATKLYWPIKDPATVPEEQKRQAFQEARNDINSKIKTLCEQLRENK